MLDKIHTTAEAEQKFRPFFDEIEFQDPADEKQVIFNGAINDDCSFLNDYGKAVQVYIFKRHYAEDRLGYVTFSYDDKDKYIFNIYLSPELFPGGRYDLPKLRKVVGIHESVHIIAMVLNLLEMNAEMQLKNFMRNQNQKLAQDVITAQLIDKISREMGVEHLMHSTGGSRYPHNIVYEDGHFRPEGDLSPINYKKLSDLLLFPKADFERYIGVELLALKIRTKNDLEGAYKDVLNQHKEGIAREMCLYEDFVVQRIAEILTAYSRE